MMGGKGQESRAQEIMLNLENMNVAIMPALKRMTLLRLRSI
jgi:hypothetical protein